MEVLGRLVVHDPRVVKLVEPPEIHRDLIIESHQLGGLIEVLKVLVVVQHLDHALDQLAIDVHGVLIEPVVEVVSQLLVLGLPVRRVRQVVFVERVLEDVLRLYDVHWPTSHHKIL